MRLLAWGTTVIPGTDHSVRPQWKVHWLGGARALTRAGHKSGYWEPR